MDEYLRFENTTFCSSTCFCSQPLFITVFLLLFVFNNTDIVITILQKTIGYQIQFSVFGISHFPPKFNVMCKFNCSKYNLRGLIFGGGVYTWKEFSFSKVGS